MVSISKRLEGGRRWRLEMYFPLYLLGPRGLTTSHRQSYGCCKAAFTGHSSPWIDRINQFVCHLFLLGSWRAHPTLIRRARACHGSSTYQSLLATVAKILADWLVYKHQTFISLIPEAGKPKTNVLADLVSDVIGWLLAVSSHGRGVQGALWGLFYKSHLSLWPNHPQRSHFQEPSHWGLGLHMDFGGDTNIQPIVFPISTDSH